MNTFFSVLLIISAVFFPSFVLAAPTTYTHPNVTPPTPAPTKPLPASTLPDGRMIPRSASSTEQSVQPVATTSSSTPSSPVILEIAALLVGVGGLVWLRRGKKLFG